MERREIYFLRSLHFSTNELAVSLVLIRLKWDPSFTYISFISSNYHRIGKFLEAFLNRYMIVIRIKGRHPR